MADFYFLIKGLEVKGKTFILPLVSTGLLGGCFDIEENNIITQRDVYQSKEDCLKDWKKEEFCQVDPLLTQEKQNQSITYNLYETNGETNIKSAEQALNNNQASNAEISSSNSSGVGTVLAGAAAGYLLGNALSHADSHGIPQREEKANQSGRGGGMVIVGPQYSEGNRYAKTSTGEVIKPTTNFSSGKPVVSKTSSTSGKSSGNTSRGGFSGKSGSSGG